ncbi:MAG TPA: phosphotransferase [Pyrinomonadaceae bacterium]|nr:phosphotransferase [Pyrinomonadaceae bacterium]
MADNSTPDKNSRAALEALELWRGDPTSLRHVADSANHVYSFEAAGRTRYLRLAPEASRTREQIEAELDFVEHLARGGVAVSLAVKSVNGERVENIRAERGLFFACVFEEAAGETFVFGTDEFNERHFRLRGRTLGRIHALAKNYEPVGARRRFRWDEDYLLRHAESYLPESEKVVWREFRYLTERLRDYPANAETFGLIHGDFGATNFRITKDSLTVFDFDDSCYHWDAYDLAVTIYPHGRRSDLRRLLAALLEGYAEARNGRTPTRDELTLFCRLRMLYMFLNYARKWGFTNLSEGQRDWFTRKRENIARGYALNY